MQVNDEVRVTDSALEMGAALSPAMLVAMRVPNRFIVRDVVYHENAEHLVLDCCRQMKDAHGAHVCHAHPAEFFEVYTEKAVTAERDEHDAETIINTPFGQLLHIGHFRDDGDRVFVKVAGLAPFEGTGALGRLAAKGLKELGLL